MTSIIQRFFFPRLTRRYLLRVLFIAGLTWLVFTRIVVPMRVDGISMEPTFPDGAIRLCWRAGYWFREPRLGDVVVVRFAGPRAALLKRIVGLPGDTIEFRAGTLYRNGNPHAEPYIAHPSDWNLPPRQVAAGNLYVVGDNRSVPIDNHYFGQTERHRVLGRVR